MEGDEFYTKIAVFVKFFRFAPKLAEHVLLMPMLRSLQTMQVNRNF